MSYDVGLSINDALGSPLYNSRYSTLGLVASGTVNTGSTITFPNTITPPIIYVRFNSTSFLMVESTTTSATFTGFNHYSTTSIPSGGAIFPVEYRVYAYANSAQSRDNYGMITYDESGRKSLDSTVPSLKPSIFNGSTSTNSGTYNQHNPFQITTATALASDVFITPINRYVGFCPVYAGASYSYYYLFSMSSTSFRVTTTIIGGQVNVAGLPNYAATWANERDIVHWWPSQSFSGISNPSAL